MDLMHALILGIVEGITEFLPVSSTGHLILASTLLHIPATDAQKSFDIAIQLGAMLAVLALFPRRLLADRATMIRVIAAFIPTGIIGFLVAGWVKAHLLGNGLIVAISLILGGVVMIAVERMGWGHKTGTVTRLSLGKAAGIGLAQTLAFIPGVSRSAATIIAGGFLGLSRTEAAEFSFFLALPTMAAATGLDVLKHPEAFAGAHVAPLLIGSLVAFLLALVSMRWFVRFVSSHTLEGFGLYRIVAGACFLLILFA